MNVLYGIDPAIGSGEIWAPWDDPATQAAPLYPPDAWFTDRAADDAPEKLTIFPDGRVAGVVAPADRCLLDGSTDCWTVPRPSDGRGSAFVCPTDADYRAAHVGTTLLASGDEIPSATIAGAGGHHPYYGEVRDPAKSEYADVGRAVARGRYVWSDQAGGIVFVGSLMPDLSEVKRVTVRCSAVSIDFRPLLDESPELKLIGACLVNIGGLPSRYRAAVMAGAVAFDDIMARRMAALMSEISYEIDGEQPDGAMICLIPDTPEALAVDGQEPADSLHLTVRYLGKADDWTPDARAELVRVAETFGAGPPVTAEVAGVGLIGQNGAGALFLNCDYGDTRQNLAGDAAVVADQFGTPVADDHPGWIPHLTLRWDAVPPDVSMIGTEVTFSTLRVVFGTEAHDITLTPTPAVAAGCTCNHQETAMNTTPNTTEAVTADAGAPPAPTADLATVEAKIDAVAEAVAQLTAMITDMHTAALDQAVSGLVEI